MCLGEFLELAGGAVFDLTVAATVQMLLGHASIATTERYCAVDDSEVRAAMVAAVGD
jgi:site-specific recombinase XerD